jgi:hypothetical protein
MRQEFALRCRHVNVASRQRLAPRVFDASFGAPWLMGIHAEFDRLKLYCGGEAWTRERSPFLHPGFLTPRIIHMAASYHDRRPNQPLAPQRRSRRIARSPCAWHRIHVVLVAVETLVVLLGPARVLVLLPVFRRVLLPRLRRLAGLHVVILVTAIALFGNRHDGGIARRLSPQRQCRKLPLFQRIPRSSLNTRF